MTTTREIAATVALLRSDDVAARAVADLIEDHGGALAALEYVLEHGSREAMELFPVEPQSTDAVDLDAIEAEVRCWRDEGMSLITIRDPEYPENLHTVHDRPPLLFVRGTLQSSDERSIAVVGTRTASEAGLARAAEMATRMIEADYVIVSGLAAGIDTAAHRAALDAGGRTLAVVGTGLRHAFPKENAALQRQLGETNAVVSHLWPDQGPRPWTFPARNAVMSGLARATLVIEAGEKSGARNQARRAREHHRPVFLLRSLMDRKWARDHASHPGVYVVDSTDEVLGILDREYSSSFALTG